MEQTTTWYPALTAEIDYRRERLAADYQRGAPMILRTVAGTVARGVARTVRAGAGRLGASRRERRARRAEAAATTTARARRAVEHLGATMDAVAARTDPRAWDREVTARGAQISAAIDVLRPQEGFGRRVA